MKIHEVIGTQAVLEQAAEECMELGHACLKMARLKRGENPTPKTEEECYMAMKEEIADVLICIGEIMEAFGMCPEDVGPDIQYKVDRWESRVNDYFIKKKGE